MTRGKRGGRPARGRRGGRSQAHVGDEFVTFSLKVGSTFLLKTTQISTRPSGCALRPLFASVECSNGYVPGLANDSNTGWYVPTALDLQLLDPSSRVVATSRPRTLGPVPRRTFVRYPRSGDWFPPTSATSAFSFMQISALCLGPVSTGGRDAFIRGLIHIRYAFSFEIINPICSYMHIEFPEPPLGDSWAEHVEAVYPSRQESNMDVRPASALTESSLSVVIDLSFLEDGESPAP